MIDGHLESLIAVDVGNSRTKWGLFLAGELVGTASLPLEDVDAYDLQFRKWSVREGMPTPSFSVASVNPDGSRPLLEWIRGRGFSPPLVIEDPAMLGLHIDVEQPEAVGIDRLLDAVAVNARRPVGSSALIADCGSAITVDGLWSDGTFVGGSIAAGLGLSARALHEFTYWLPLLNVSAVPRPLGKSTPDAMRSGLFWGTVGAVKELIRRIGGNLDTDPIVFVTGGDGELLAPHLDQPVELVPELTLHGILLATQHVRSHQRE